ncbi:MAG: class I SAM-dependent methyltransferase [Magnetococcales bacterium]|nr:class I SAM-dependent methyltransferase [Magnetococcales bacterium]
MRDPASRFYQQVEVLRARVRTLAGTSTGHALDIGCKKGDVSSALAKTMRCVTALDPYPHPDWQVLQETHSNLNFVQGDGQNLPFSDASFERVVACECLMYMDPDRTLKECHRVLKPDGLLVVTFPEAGPITQAIDPYNLERLFINVILPGRVSHRQKAHHLKSSTLLDAASDNGWQLEHMERRGSILFIYLAWWIDRLQIRHLPEDSPLRHLAAQVTLPVLKLLFFAMRMDCTLRFGPLSYNTIIVLKKSNT